MKLLLFFVVVFLLVGPASATTYYVKNGGNNSADGLSDTGAWETVGKVNGFSFSTGDDVYFKCDNTWTEQVLYVDWAGTSENKVIIGSYYGDGTIGLSGEKPIFDGNSNTPTEGSYIGLVDITVANIDVRNMRLINSGGLGVNAKETNNITISNVETYRTWWSGIRYKIVDNGLIDNCYVDHAGLVSTGGARPWPAGISLIGSTYITTRRALITHTYGEGFGSFTTTSSYVCGNNTLEYSILYANRAIEVAIINSDNNTIRYNLIYGTTNTTFWRGGYPSHGLYVADEAGRGGSRSRNNLFYSNLVANSHSGIWIGTTAETGSNFRESAFYNNIIMDCYNSVRIYGNNNYNSSIRNNIIWSSNESAQLYYGPDPLDHITWSNNLWSVDPGSVVNGSGDIIDDPDTFKSTGWQSLIPDELDGSEFTLNSTSPAIDVGTDLGSPYNMALDSSSTWVNYISLLDQDDYGTGWEIGAFVYGTAAESPAPTASDFTYYKIITINQTMVNQSIGAGIYPLLVSTTDTDLRDHAQADGDDIVFFASDNTTLLPYEQEFWNSTTGELVEHIGVTDITNVSYIVMYYNNSTIANSENAEGVWDSNFVVVQHLNETPAGTTYDSTSNNNDGTTVNLTSADQVSGQVDGSLDLDGDDHISLSNVAIGNNAAFTISTWMNGADGTIVYGEGYSGDTAWAAFLGIVADTNISCYYIKENNAWKAITLGTTQVNDGWHYITLTQINKSYRTIYIDGVAEDTNTDTVGDMSILDTASIGVLERATFTSYLIGTVDELRISDSARSAEWTKTEYNNTAYPTLFISVGAEQGGEGTPDTKFEYWDGNSWEEGESYYYLWFTCFWCTPECANAEQLGGQATLKITNNGTASGTPKMKLNESAPAGIEIYVDDDNTFAGAVELTNTYQAVSTSLNQDTNITLWAWSNLSQASAWEFETYAIVE